MRKIYQYGTVCPSVYSKTAKGDGHIKQMFVIRKEKEDCIILILNAIGDIKTFLE